MTIGYGPAAAAGAGLPPAPRLIEALMADPDVVTVRVNGGGGTAVYRVDVPAATAAAAEQRAGLPALAAAAALGLEIDVASVTAVTDAERVAVFLARIADRR